MAMCQFYGTLWGRVLCPFFCYLMRLILSHCHSNLTYLQAEVTSGQITALLEATGNTEVEAFYPIIFANFLTPEKIAELIATPGGAGGGGGGGAGGGGAGGDAAEEEEEEKVEEEEMEAPAVDMFGGDDGGDY
jgi:ribosomal protein L12E/L44/L45/RPP1/RPP2